MNDVPTPDAAANLAEKVPIKSLYPCTGNDASNKNNDPTIL